LLGEGAFGKVYKGSLRGNGGNDSCVEPRVVAVKMLKGMFHNLMSDCPGHTMMFRLLAIWGETLDH